MADKITNEAEENYKVYRLTNQVNGKIYFGLTKRKASTRMTQHQGEARRGSKLLISRAIAKHGWDSFSVDIVASRLSQNDACDLEVSLIKLHNACGPQGYNISSGGQHGVYSRPETRALKSASAKAAWEKSKVWQDAIHCPDRLRKIGEASKEMHKKPEFKMAFKARHSAMVEASCAEGVRLRAVETFKSNGHCTSVIMQGGALFETASDAARWVQANTRYKKAAVGNILNCANGKRAIAYGLSWSLGQIPDDGNLT